MFTVALTGGIASGKSSIAGYFSELGVTVVDADQIAHRLIRHDSIAKQILDYFGPTVFNGNKLNRARLRDIIFSNIPDRDWLEQLMHPLIYKEIQATIDLARSPYVLVVIPLLFEGRTIELLTKKPTSGNYIDIDRILLVTTSKVLQVERLSKRDQANQKQIDAILSSQISPQEALGKADDIIYNRMTLTALAQTTARFHQLYLSFAHAKNIALDKSSFLRYYLALK